MPPTHAIVFHTSNLVYTRTHTHVCAHTHWPQQLQTSQTLRTNDFIIIYIHYVQHVQTQVWLPVQLPWGLPAVTLHCWCWSPCAVGWLPPRWGWGKLGVPWGICLHNVLSRHTETRSLIIKLNTNETQARKWTEVQHFKHTDATLLNVIFSYLLWSAACWKSIVRMLDRNQTSWNASTASHIFWDGYFYVWVNMYRYTCSSWGAGIAKWLEHQTCDWKDAGLSPSRSSRRMFFSRVNFLCWLCITTVAGTRAGSFCQKCRWLNTHVLYIITWLQIKCHCKLVHGCMVFSEHALRQQQFHMASTM